MIPYTIERRPDTGINNVMLGTWLFLASEVMLFGGLFSAYVLLRSGADAWPSGTLDVLAGGLITAVMIASSLAISAAARLAGRDTGRAITMLNVTSWLAVIFIGLKTWEWAGHLGHGMYPATSTFAALYFLFTGVHAIHVAGGLVANVYARFAAATEERFRNRLAAVALYWYFVDIVWLVIFVLLYVL